LFAIILLIPKLLNLFDLIDYDDTCFVFKGSNFYPSSRFVEWLRLYSSVVFFYTGILTANEPNLSIFWEKFSSKSYESIEIITVSWAFMFTIAFTMGCTTKFLEEYLNLSSKND
jgi:hypothetical protein